MDTSTRDESFTAAFDGLFLRSFRLANRTLADAESAEDIAAEALARAYARWDRIGSEVWVDGWVLRVVTNLAIDVTRKRGREQRGNAVERAEQLATNAGSVTDPSGNAATLRVALAAALERLPRRQREVVALRYLADLSEADVAMTLGVSAGAVKSHLHRGTNALRARLGPGFEEVASDA